MASFNIKAFWYKLHRLYAKKTSSKQRVKYLRKIGAKIGEKCRIDTVDFSKEPYLVNIGDRVAMSSGTRLITHDGSIRLFKPELKGGIFGKITIKNNVFIGINCIILLNTTIGENTIVGAGSVVRGNIPANSVIAGNPAKIICKTNTLKFLFKTSPGRLQTDGLTEEAKDELVKNELMNKQQLGSWKWS